MNERQPGFGGDQETKTHTFMRTQYTEEGNVKTGKMNRRMKVKMKEEVNERENCNERKEGRMVGEKNVPNDDKKRGRAAEWKEQENPAVEN